jgi:transcriptional regulator with XRE-family HTH domain
MDEKSISSNIKKIRKQKKMTLQELADRTGLTKGYLSKVERSEKAPPYSTLNRIAGALGVEVTTVLKKDFAPLQDTSFFFGKKSDEQIICETTDFAGYDYVVLGAGKPGKNMEPFIIYAPFEIARMYEHEGEEFFYVMEGRLEFIYGDKTCIMETGDHVYFDSRIPHSGRSLGDKKAKLMVVIYFYKRNRQ